MEKSATNEKIKILQKQSSYLDNKRASFQRYLERMLYENREYVTLSGIMKACVPFNIVAAVGGALIKQQPIGVIMSGLCAATLVNIAFTLKKIKKDNKERQKEIKGIKQHINYLDESIKKVKSEIADCSEVEIDEPYC